MARAHPSQARLGRLRSPLLLLPSLLLLLPLLLLHLRAVPLPTIEGARGKGRRAAQSCVLLAPVLLLPLPLLLAPALPPTLLSDEQPAGEAGGGGQGPQEGGRRVPSPSPSPACCRSSI